MFSFLFSINLSWNFELFFSNVLFVILLLQQKGKSSLQGSGHLGATHTKGRQATPQNSCWSPRPSPALAHSTWRDLPPSQHCTHCPKTSQPWRHPSFTHRAGGRAGQCFMASHTLQVLQEHPKQGQVQLGNLCLLVLKAGTEKNPSKKSRFPTKWKKGSSWAKTCIDIYLYLHTGYGVWERELVWLLISTSRAARVVLPFQQQAWGTQGCWRLNNIPSHTGCVTN